MTQYVARSDADFATLCQIQSRHPAKKLVSQLRSSVWGAFFSEWVKISFCKQAPALLSLGF